MKMLGSYICAIGLACAIGFPVAAVIAQAFRDAAAVIVELEAGP